MKQYYILFLLFHLYVLPATIIFDMNGVLSYQDKITLGYHIGPFALTKYGVCHGIWTLRTYIADILQAIPYSINEPILPTDDIGKPLAPIITAWLKGILSGDEALEHIRQFFTENRIFSTVQQNIAYSFARALFTPQLFAQATHFYDETIELVKQCKTLGHNLYILSNWDKDSFIYVYDKKRDLFDLFNAIVISGEVNMVKPNLAIYRYIIGTFSLDPSTTAFIDDQRVNIRAAKQCGLFSIHCKSNHAFFAKPDISLVRKKLDAWLHKIGQACLCNLYV